MNTTSFLAALRAHASLPLIFRSGGQVVPSGYHLTEVKRVSYETMDCGAMMHRWEETQFEIWVPAAESGANGRGHMPAEKFLQIIERVDRELPLRGGATARILASFDGPAALHDIAGVRAHDGRLWIDLSPDRARCKAAERRDAATHPGCCGGASAAAEDTPAAADGCGCGAAGATARAAAACCA